MSRARNEYKYTVGFAAAIALLMGIVIWNLGAQRVSSSDQFRVPHPGEQFATASSSGGEQIEAGAAQAVQPSEKQRPGQLRGLAAAPELDGSVASQPDAADTIAKPPSELTAASPELVGGRLETVWDSFAWWRDGASAPQLMTRSSFGGMPSAPGFGGPVGLRALPAGEKSSSESANALDGSARVQPQNTPSRARITADEGGESTSSELSTSNEPSTSSEPSTWSGPSISTSSPAAAALGAVGLLSAPVDAASISPLGVSSAVTNGVDPVAAESILTEAVAGDADFAVLVSDYSDPIKMLLESTAGAEGPVITQAVTETPAAVPEPVSLLLFGSGLGLIAHRVRRREPARGQ